MVVFSVDAHIELESFDVFDAADLTKGVHLVHEGICQHVCALNGRLLTTVVHDGEHADVILQAIDCHLLAHGRDPAF